MTAVSLGKHTGCWAASVVTWCRVPPGVKHAKNVTDGESATSAIPPTRSTPMPIIAADKNRERINAGAIRLLLNVLPAGQGKLDLGRTGMAMEFPVAQLVSVLGGRSHHYT